MIKMRSPIYEFFFPLGIFLFVLFCFKDTLAFPFINFDDPAYIVNNKKLALKGWDFFLWSFQSFDCSNWHPLTWWSLKLDLWLSSASAGKMHLHNNILHGFNSLWVYFLWIEIFQPKKRIDLLVVLLFALIFALHPQRGESVAWVSERKDLLSAFFGLSSLWAYLKSHRLSKKSYLWGAWTLLLLGLLAKPSLITFPFIFILLDLFPLNRLHEGWFKAKVWFPLLKEKTIGGLFILMSAWLTFLAQSQGGAVKEISVISLWERVGNVAIAYIKYLSLFTLPYGLSPFYPYPESFGVYWSLLAWIFLILFSIWVVKSWKKYPFLFLGWFWFLGSLVPMIGLVQVGDQALADRYTYLSHIGLLIILYGLWQNLSKKLKKGFTLGLILWGIVLVSIHYRHLGTWKSTEAFYQRVIKVYPSHYMTYNLAGRQAYQLGQLKEARTYLEKAYSLKPSHPILKNNLASVLFVLRELDRSISLFQEVLEQGGAREETFLNLGKAWILKKNPQEAFKVLKKGNQNFPQSGPLWRHLGLALYQLGAYDKAKDVLEESLKWESFQGTRALIEKCQIKLSKKDS